MSTHVLLVDTFQERRQQMGITLAAAGFSISEADRTNVALALASECDVILAYHQPLDALNLIDHLRMAGDRHPLVLLAQEGSEALAVEAFRRGVTDYLSEPFDEAALRASLDRVQRQVKCQPNGTTDALRSMMNGKLPDTNVLVEEMLDSILKAAVEVAEADTASILLDDGGGNLYVRASLNMDARLAGELLLPIDDSLAGQAMRTGQPVFVNGDEDHKIKTAYFVRSLAYLPLRADGDLIGVLGVDNRFTNRSFADWQMRSLAVLADFASMALAYAGRYVDVRQERDWLDAILAGAEEPVLVTDMAGAILLCNPSARRILGIPVAYYGMAADRLDHEGIKRLLHAKQAKRAQITLDDDCVYNAQMTIIPELGRVIVMQDISHFVEVDRLKTNFVSNVSQDLRSPLTAILGYVELLTRAGSVNAQQQMFIERITLSAQSISHLISDLLDLSRIESSSVGAQAECVPLPLICDYAHAALEGELKARKQRFSLEVADEDASVRGNAQRLKQMLRNLLQNASQYSADGGQIRLRLRTENDLILIEVEDNGIGIPLEDQPHIFEKFYRSNAVRDRFDGAGLGLAIVKSIVDQHHGRIWVESTPGQGSKFTVILPACAG